MKINVIKKENLSPSLLEYLEKLDYRMLRVDQLRHIDKRDRRLAEAHNGRLPDYPNTKLGSWKASVPEWMQDQRNQMTGPADNGELVVKLLNSGSPGVMLDLEDSMVNDEPELRYGIMNCIDALHGELSYFRNKNGRQEHVHINTDSGTVIFIRVRGLHMTQRIEGFGDIPAPLFDLAALTHGLDNNKMKHPLCIYIPKSEYSTEAYWWSDVFRSIENLQGWPVGYIKAMALVESHPMAYEMEEFAFHMQPYLVGLNLGRWDYMASLTDYHFNEKLLSDRNSIPTDVPFFQNLRHRMAYVCHHHGMLAIGGMTALFPDRTNKKLNINATSTLLKDKQNEAACLMDGAWTGHPDQNEIAVNAFPYPNQLDKLPHKNYYRPNLTSGLKLGFGISTYGPGGTKEALKVATQYRHGVLKGKGATLINGYMEDLATDRIYRILVSQRLHRGVITRTDLDNLCQEVLEELGPEYQDALMQTVDMIVNKEFNPK